MALNYTSAPKQSFANKPSPADALQMGVHTSLAASSKHKKTVSGVLHLKKESIGKTNKTAYVKGAKAFGQQKPKKVT